MGWACDMTVEDHRSSCFGQRDRYIEDKSLRGVCLVLATCVGHAPGCQGYRGCSGVEWTLRRKPSICHGSYSEDLSLCSCI